MQSHASAQSAAAKPAPVHRIGRFALREALGRGAQSEVHLAHDAALDREVAIKLLKPGPHQDARNLLNEARAVSRLRHPGIVPVHEAGLHQGQPYLVFEYVAGQTLAQLLRRDAPLEPVRACRIVCEVLAALQASHDHGIVHRDLKPANILLDENGTVRVTDFGIASTVEAGGRNPHSLRGTPAYMAPEYVQGGQVTPLYDLHACGLILFELLLGRHPYAAPQAMQTLYRLTHETAEIPEDARTRLGEDLIGLMLRAMARDPAARFASAREMQRALEQEIVALERRGSGTPGISRLDQLLLKIADEKDFPTLGNAISTIQRMSDEDAGSVDGLSNSILKDFALTNKILRLANSAYYPRRAGGAVSTVSRAVVILGLNAVRDISISLLLFQHLKDQSHATQLKNEFLRINLAGLVAQQLAGQADSEAAEQAFIGGLFHNLGRLIACYYFREAYENIEHLCGSGRDPAKTQVQVLGVSYESLGLGVARSWGLPAALINSIEHLCTPPQSPPKSAAQALRTVSSCGAELAELIERGPIEEQQEALRRLAKRFGIALDLKASHLRQAAQQAQARLREMAAALQIDLHTSALGRRLLHHGPENAGPDGTNEAGPQALTPGECPPPQDLNPPTLTGTVVDPAAVLMQGLQEVSEAMIDRTPLNQVLGIACESIFRALQPDQVIVALADGAGRNMRGQTGFGDEVLDMLKRFQFPLAPGSDLFSAALRKPADLLIQDARCSKVLDNLPFWFRKRFDPSAFLLLPIKAGRQPLGLIYAHSKDHPLALPETALSTLRAVRNQLALALSQAR